MLIYLCFKRTTHKPEAATPGVPKMFTSFTGKHLCWSLFLITRDSNKVFSCEYCKSFKNTYFEQHLQTTASDKYENRQEYSEHCETFMIELSMKIVNSENLHRYRLKERHIVLLTASLSKKKR